MEWEKYKAFLLGSLVFIFLGLAVLLVLLPASPLNMPLTFRDPGVFLYSGWRLLLGETPYLDFWDHKPPLIFFTNALGLWIGNGSRWGVWAIELISLYAAALLGFVLIKKTLGTVPAVFSTILWLLGLFFVLDGGNLTTEYALPFQFAILLLMMKLYQKPDKFWPGYLIGIMIGVLFLYKQTAIGVGLAALTYLVIKGVKQKQVRQLLRSLSSIALGTFSICLVIVLYLLSRNALAEFWDAVFVYNFAYVSTSIRDKILGAIKFGNPFSSIVPFQIGLIGYLTALALLTVQTKKFGNGLTMLLTIGSIDVPIEILLIGLSGRYYNHYYITLLPALSLFTGFVFWILISQISSFNIKKWMPTAITIVLSLGLIWGSARNYNSYIKSWATEATDIRGVVAFIEQNTDPDDTVLFWGAEVKYNFLSKRASPTRFIYQYPLYAPKYVDEGKVIEYLDDILEGEPRYIFDTRNSVTPIFDFPIMSPLIDKKVSQITSRYNDLGLLGDWQVYGIK